jgi:hypothetical protein
MTSTMAIVIFLMVVSAGLLVYLEMYSRRKSRENENAARLDGGSEQEFPPSGAQPKS